jgi:hypothetical protein
VSREKMEYKLARSKMNPGDVIAFSGKGHFSEIIKWATRASVSHVGIILQSRLVINNEPQKGYFNQIIESASLNGFSGVSVSRLSDRIATYDGEMWWLPLSDMVRKKLDLKKFYDFLIHQDHKPYDMPQAVKSALDTFDNTPILSGMTFNIEDFSKFFCSELVAAGLEAGGAISSVNASEVTPIDLCMFNIYQPSYYQIKGGDKDIKAYNTVSPEGWGE